MTGEIVYLTNRSDLKLFLKNHSVVIVKIGATWCGPCKKIQPYIEQYYSELNNVSLVVVDADQGSDICSYLKIKSLPTLLNYVDGSPHDILTSSNINEVKNFFLNTAKRSLFKNASNLENL